MTYEELRARLYWISDEEFEWVKRRPNLEAMIRDGFRVFDDLEEARIDRWHATYNAALTRLASFTHGAAAAESEIARVHKTIHDACVLYANAAHGPLVKP